MMPDQQWHLSGAGEAEAGGGYLYWRVHITVNQALQGAAISELQFRGEVGGANLATGGTAIAGVESTPAANAYDSDNATYWWDAASLPSWIGYQFSEAVDIAEVRITAGPGATFAKKAPMEFTVEYSDDGSAWSVAGTFSTGTWGGNQSRNFVI